MEEIMDKWFGLLVAALVLLAGPVLAAPRVFVTIAPQKYFVDKVSGGQASVSVMVEPGANPHAYEPKPRQMAELAGADIYFTIGDSFDQTWLKRIVGASPGIAVVHTAEGIEKMPMAGDAHGEDEHGHEGEAPAQGEGEHHPAEAEAGHGHGDEPHGHGHEHGSLDPHIWLDPALVKVQVGHIRDGLSRVDPAGAATYAANAAAFMTELDRLDAEIHATLNVLPADRRTFLVFHPSWGYFARAYGLQQASIEVEGKEPSARDMARIVATGKENGVRVVFVQPQFSEKSAGVIAGQLGARVARLDPLAEDWADNLRRAVQAFVEALR
jgi:zinc transport system substrate-binding protein